MGGVYRLGTPYAVGCVGCMRDLLRSTQKGKSRAGMMAHCELTAPDTHEAMMKIIGNQAPVAK